MKKVYKFSFKYYFRTSELFGTQQFQVMAACTITVRNRELLSQKLSKQYLKLSYMKDICTKMFIKEKYNYARHVFISEHIIVSHAMLGSILYQFRTTRANT
jgi:hypothetical protein